MSIETKFKIITGNEELSGDQKRDIIDFLFKNLEQYSDSKENIGKALEHIFSETSPEGGFILLSHQYLDISGVVVVNRTGMEGYIPENILVYIAVRKDLRGKGVGRALLQQAVDIAKGDIALHVEPDNPAKYLYESMGFENKYLEMRLIKK